MQSTKQQPMPEEPKSTATDPRAKVNQAGQDATRNVAKNPDKDAKGNQPKQQQQPQKAQKDQGCGCG